MCGFFNLWVFWKYVYLHLVGFVLFVLCFRIVPFMNIYSYLFCLYWCKDYCHRAETQLQLIIVKQSRYRPGQAQRVPGS